jgi:hypothetical protein
MSAERRQPMKRRARRTTKARSGPRAGIAGRGEITGLAGLAGEVASHHETGPALSGGDVDADWQRAHDSGEEAVGGSVATPDQDVVDEIGRALGVPQESGVEVRASEEILRSRDRLRWHLEREAADLEEGRPRHHHHEPA